jgi:thiosulfate/3-mercaptopyruvate sulfurtransferase
MTVTNDRSQWLVQTDWLEAHLEDSELRIFDCTTKLVPDPKTVYRIEDGRADWKKAHIPGAGYLDLQGELSDPDTRLRFMLPPAEQFADVMSRSGVAPGSRVILYSAGPVFWATRIFWMLRAFGFDDVAVLDGGWQKWQLEGRSVSTEAPRHPPARFVARPRPELFVDKSDVQAAIGDGKICILNALARDQHSGESRMHYGRPGRIPSSEVVPAMELLDPTTGAFRPAAELRALFGEAGALDADRVVTYCGGGIAASATAFALGLLGRENVAIYDASLSEWAQDESLPMEKG